MRIIKKKFYTRYRLFKCIDVRRGGKFLMARDLHDRFSISANNNRVYELNVPSTFYYPMVRRLLKDLHINHPIRAA